jgi:hypothetical protein
MMNKPRGNATAIAKSPARSTIARFYSGDKRGCFANDSGWQAQHLVV